MSGYSLCPVSLLHTKCMPDGWTEVEDQSTHPSHGEESSGCEGLSPMVATSPSMIGNQAPRVPTIKEVVASIYCEPEGTVLVLKKIQRLGFNAGERVREHFALKYGLIPSRVEVVHSRRHTKSAQTTGALRSPNISYVVFSDATTVDLIMGFSQNGLEDIGGVPVTIQRFLKGAGRASSCPIEAAAAKCPVVQAAAIDPELAIAVLEWLQIHEGALDNHPSVWQDI